MERALVAGRGSAAGCRGHRAGRPSSRLLRGIARGLKPRVAAGADGRRALELRELPEVFWDRLAEFLGACEEVGSWPEPLRVGVVALLPRPIVLLPSTASGPLPGGRRLGPGLLALGRTGPRHPAGGLTRLPGGWPWRRSALGARRALRMIHSAGSFSTAASAMREPRSSNSTRRLRRRSSRTGLWCWRSACTLAGATCGWGLRCRRQC